MKINLEEVEKITKRRNEINKPKLDELEIYQNGRKLKIDKDRIDEHNFTGLNNIDFLNELITEKKSWLVLQFEKITK